MGSGGRAADGGGERDRAQALFPAQVPGCAPLQDGQLVAQDEDLDLVRVSERTWSTIQVSSLANTW
jgi:hypothetical protein